MEVFRQIYPPPLTFLHVQLILTSSLLSPWLIKLRIEGLTKEVQLRVNVVCSMKCLVEDEVPVKAKKLKSTFTHTLKYVILTHLSQKNQTSNTSYKTGSHQILTTQKDKTTSYGH
ncbi:hypothetical protein RND81_05G003100 [Saponaria officinalis]|uniref:Uncharacterized protein n=1 Tax=Saponaria officinalis TaxID=3572 RepID=A0AAW1KQ75_SAPOF